MNGLFATTKLPACELATWPEADLLCRAYGSRLLTYDSASDDQLANKYVVNSIQPIPIPNKYTIIAHSLSLMMSNVSTQKM